MRITWPVLICFGVGCAADINAPPVPPAAVVAQFDPLATPANIPLPNDLAFTGGDGTHLNVPSAPTDSPAQMDFNAYLSQLDGFPGSSTGTANFSAALDPASIRSASSARNGSVLVFNSTSGQIFTDADYAVTPSTDGKTINIVPSKRWQSGNTYAVVIFGGDDADGVQGALVNGQPGKKVIAAPVFYFLRSPKPLLGTCGDGTAPECQCPASVVMGGNTKETTCHAVVAGITDEQAHLLEPGRLQLSAGLEQILPFAGTTTNGPRLRENVVLMWTFTIAKSPMAVFDPTHGDVPFPNDILIDQTSHLVNLPVNPSDPTAAINMGLNQLDGFSTTARQTVSVDVKDALDPATLIPGKTAILMNITTLVNQPTGYTAAPVLVNNGMDYAGQVAIQPQALQSDQARYVVVLTTDVKDKTGRTLQPAPPTALVKSKNPLFDGTHSTVSALDDATAQQLETLRMAYANGGLFGALQIQFSLPREKIAALWTFTTQSITRPLMALDQYPTKAALSTDVTLSHVSNRGEIDAKKAQLPFCNGDYSCDNLGAVAFGSFNSRGVVDPTTGIISFSRTVVDAMDLTKDTFDVTTPSPAPAAPIKFVMTVPKTGSNWPVAIVQHGLGSWRGQTITIADRFAAAGWATIAIDLPFHGARSACTADADCASGAAGSCNKTTGVCTGGLKLATVADDPFACSVEPLSGDASDCRPTASGNAFINVSNLFATRDNGRQFAVDAAELVRVLQATGGNSLAAALAGAGVGAHDGTKLAYIGQSLGGIAGAVFLAVAPQPTVGVLNVTGGHDLEMLADGSYHTLIDPYLMSLGIMRDTAAYLQLVSVARMILDPVDPFAVAPHLVSAPVTPYLTGTANAPKVLILQTDGNDSVIPLPYQEALGGEIFGAAGLDANGHTQGTPVGSMTPVSTFFPAAEHGTLLVASPSAAAMQAEQNQAVTWIASGGATLPAAQ